MRGWMMMMNWQMNYLKFLNVFLLNFFNEIQPYVESYISSIYDVIPNMPDNEFRKMFRTTKEGFKSVLELIKNSQVFQNSSQHKQVDPSIQLAVALARFGSNGTGGSVSKLQAIFQIGAGTVTLYTNRVIETLLELHDDWIKCPDTRRRSENGQVMREESFPGCVGFVDGTTINISQKSAKDGEVYFDRKKR